MDRRRRARCGLSIRAGRRPAAGHPVAGERAAVEPGDLRHPVAVFGGPVPRPAPAHRRGRRRRIDSPAHARNPRHGAHGAAGCVGGRHRRRRALRHTRSNRRLGPPRAPAPAWDLAVAPVRRTDGTVGYLRGGGRDGAGDLGPGAGSGRRPGPERPGHRRSCAPGARQRRDPARVRGRRHDVRAAAGPMARRHHPRVAFRGRRTRVRGASRGRDPRRPHAPGGLPLRGLDLGRVPPAREPQHGLRGRHRTSAALEPDGRRGLHGAERARRRLRLPPRRRAPWLQRAHSYPHGDRDLPALRSLWRLRPSAAPR